MRQARRAVEEGRWAVLETDVIYADLLDLDVLIHELPDLLLSAFSEITPDVYKGRRPPARSYKERIKDAELFAFLWRSKELQCDVYLKFAMKNDTLWLVSFHRNRGDRKQ